MKKLYKFNRASLTWNMTTFANNIQLALAFASEAENNVPVFIFDDDNNFCRGANGPVLSYLSHEKKPSWHSRRFDNPVECVVAWRKLCQKGYARRIKFASPIVKEYKAGTTNTDAIPMPREILLLAKEAEQAQAKPQAEPVVQPEPQHVINEEPVSAPAVQPAVSNAAKRVTVNKHTSVTRRVQTTKVKTMHHSRRISRMTEQQPCSTNDQQSNVLAAAEAQLAMATMSAPMQAMMQLAKSGQIEAPEMPKFDEADLPSMDYEGFDYDDLAGMDHAIAIKQPVKQPVKELLPWEGEDRFPQESNLKPAAKPAVKKPVAVTTPDYSDDYNNYLPPYPTEEDDASWDMY